MPENTSEQTINEINDKINELLSIAYKNKIPIVVMYEAQVNDKTEHFYKVLTPSDYNITVDDDKTAELALTACRNIELHFVDEKKDRKRKAINDALNEVFDL